jgi:peptidyl-prolyl cis-trans isomerase A (cyclophilin A)
MNLRTAGQRARLVALAAIAALLPQLSNATIVEFRTNMGDIQVNLYDNATPETVANFLNYVNNGLYTNSIFHRSVTDFVIQGGGFVYNNVLPLDEVPPFDPVVNEPEFANVRGTIAMAKVGGDPNSATSQWFFSLADNTAILDAQNGGFTVFGEVVDPTMDVVDAIASLPIFNFGGATAETPLQNFTQQDFDAGTLPDGTQLIVISEIVVIDSTVDSAAGLNPPANTGGPAAPPPATSGGGGGGGSFGFIGLFALLLVRRFRHA